MASQEIRVLVLKHATKHLSRVQMLSVDGQWIMTEIPRKAREIINRLEIPIIHG